MGVSLKKYIRYFIEWAIPSIWFYKRSYSQDGEDVTLESLLACDKNYKGFYIDVGAHHPYRFSNTALFYKKGWRGINIEPTPTLFGPFERHRKDDINLNVGVSHEKDVLEFFEFDEPALNSFDKEKSEDIDKGVRYNITKRSLIPVQTLESILDEYCADKRIIDFITIDAEGWDLNVIKSNNWDKYNFKFVLVEADVEIANLFENEVYQYLIARNYELVGLLKRTSIFRLKMKN